MILNPPYTYDHPIPPIHGEFPPQFISLLPVAIFQKRATFLQYDPWACIPKICSGCAHTSSHLHVYTVFSRGTESEKNLSQGV